MMAHRDNRSGGGGENVERSLPIGVLMLVVLLAALPGLAQSRHAAVRQACLADRLIDAPVRIDSCSGAIASTTNPDLLRTYYFNRGVAFHDAGQTIQAVLDYDKALSYLPPDGQALINRGLIRQQQGRIDTALADFDRAIEVEPDLAGAWISRCAIYAINIRQYAQALADCNEGIRLDGYNAAAFDMRGLVNLHMRNLSQARADFDRALRMEPDDPHHLYGRGLVRLRMADSRGGHDDLARARRGDPTIDRVYAGYGLRP
jgi:tetratricopeptide (TPR) repeat protein